MERRCRTLFLFLFPYRGARGRGGWRNEGGAVGFPPFSLWRAAARARAQSIPFSLFFPSSSHHRDDRQILNEPLFLFFSFFLLLFLPARRVDDDVARSDPLWRSRRSWRLSSFPSSFPLLAVMIPSGIVEGFFFFLPPERSLH